MILCKRQPRVAARLDGVLLERLPAWAAVDLISRAFREDASTLRKYAWSLELVDLASLPRWSDQDLLRQFASLVERGILEVSRRSAGALDANATSTRQEDIDLLAAFRRQSQNRLVVKGGTYELVIGSALVRGRVPDDAQVVPRAQSLTILGDLIAANSTGVPLKEVLKKVRGALAQDWRPPIVPEGLVLLRKVSRGGPPASDRGPAVTPSAMKPPAEPKHWVEFRFKDEGGRALKGITYAIGLPDDSQVDGKLNGQGQVRYESQPSGSATIELADVDEATWGASETDAHNPVDLIAVASGVDPGEAVKFEVFRLYRERPADVVATINGKLDGSLRAVAHWTPDSIDQPDDDYVFKATVAGAWRKSDPLEVASRAIAADWDPSQATEGDSVTLRASMRGVADGESATLTIFEKLWRASSDTKLASLSGTVSAGAVEASWTVPAAASPPVFGDAGRRDFYYTIEVGALQATSTSLATFPDSEEASPDDDDESPDDELPDDAEDSE